MMNCDEARRSIRAAIDTDTVLDRATRVHLATCSDCRDVYADWLLERALSHDWMEPPRDGFVDQVIAAAARDGAAARLRRLAVAATIGVLAVGLGLFVGLRSNANLQMSVGHVDLIAHQGKQVRLVIDSVAPH